MERHPEKLSQGVTRRNGPPTPFNAGDAVGATTDICRGMGIPLAPSIRGRIGKGAKALLASDFSPEIVVAACVTAVRTGWFGSVESIAQEMAVAASGNRQTRTEYQAALAHISEHLKRNESKVWQTMRDELARRRQAEERGIEQ